MRAYYAICRQCKKKAKDEKMIYVVGTDSYYCNQQCKDIYDGVRRDKNGFVIFEKERSRSEGD